MFESRYIHTYIDRPSPEVYAFASNPKNLPLWAGGLAQSEVKKQGDAWVAEAPFGKATIRFAAPNDFGVMDHEVEVESGLVVHNPMRVVGNGEGSEFTFILFRQPYMTQEQFEADARMVEKDLQSLKQILERRA